MSQPTRVDIESKENKSIIDFIGSDSNEHRRYDESSLLRDRRLSKTQRIILILYYEWEFNFKEIGDLLAVSDSRISQMHDKALQEQKKRIQENDSSLKKRKRQCVKSKEVSSKIQEMSHIQRKEKNLLGKIFEKERIRLEKRKTQEISKKIFRTFRIKTF